MSIIDRTKLFWRRLNNSRKHSGAGEAIPVWRLAKQALPYYVDPDGRAFAPLTVFFSINGRCNLHCRMCDIGQQKPDSMFYKNLKGESAQDFPFERFKSLVDEFAQFNFKPYIGITTTEPLLYPKMWDAVEYANSRGLSMNISTNGLLLEKQIDAILDSGLHRLSISLDGPPDIHDKMRGLNGLFEKVSNGMRLLADEKKKRNTLLPHVYVSSFICDTNHRDLVRLLENLPEGCYEWINMKLMVFFTQKMVALHNEAVGDKYPATASCFPPDFNANNLDVNLIYEQTMEINRRFSHICSLHFEPDKEKLKRYFYEPHKFMDASKCIFPWFISQITNEGKMIVFTRCYSVAFDNILDKSFMEAWNGKKIREFRKDLRKRGRFPGCARCDGVLFR